MGADSTVLALNFLETENGRRKFTSRMHALGNNRLAQKSVDYHTARLLNSPVRTRRRTSLHNSISVITRATCFPRIHRKTRQSDALPDKIEVNS